FKITYNLSVPSIYLSPLFSTSRYSTIQRARSHGIHPVHLPAEREGVGGGAGGGGEEVAAGGGEAGVAAAVAAERGGAGEREREGGADVLLQVREQGRRGRRHLRQPGQGRLRPRRRRAVLQLHGDAGGGGHLRQDGGAAEPGHPPGGHPPHARRLRGRQAQARGAPPRRRQVRRQGRRRPDGARPRRRRHQGVHPRLRRHLGRLIDRFAYDDDLDAWICFGYTSILRIYLFFFSLFQVSPSFSCVW
uniref:Uncharacterized protein n=1 Tax=Oryza nivara TaxID=4536 RepID=A0A0E0I1I3_ORYNI